MRFSNEIKAGLLVVIAVLVGAMFFLKTASLKKETYSLMTSFGYAGDLKPNAVVKLSGIEVGRVKEISFQYEPKTMIECLLEIDADAKVRKDSVAYISTSGFVGDAYVGVTSGTSQTFASSGDIIESEDPIESRILMKKAESIADNLDQVIANIKDVIAGNRENLNEIVENVEVVTENFKEFSADIKKHPWKLMFKGE
ncbi:MAG: MlaD family protein [Candidatus Aadella gelida]|nr:MlaD family protein [Candidatus Aadella gelida]